jgi:hypothetical protein
MPLEEQREILANRIKQLELFRFLLRPAIAEGDIGSEVQSFSLRTDDRDPMTGEYHFPDQEIMARLRLLLAPQSGIPIAAILKEQEARRLSVQSTSIPARQPPQRNGDFQPRRPSPQDTPEDSNLPDVTRASSSLPTEPRHHRRRRLA